MTRVPIQHLAPPKPPSVVVGELAIAAGTVGHSVTLSYRDFPAPLLCDLWKYYTQSVGDGEVYHVREQGDVRKLAGRVAEVRLVLVHARRLHNPTSWAIRMSTSNGADAISRPAVFSRFEPDDADEDPGATLVLRGNENEHGAIMQWLGIRECFQSGWMNTQALADAPFVPALGRILSPNHSLHGQALQRHRDRQVLHGLMAGACLVRSSRAGREENAPLTINLDDYEQVRRLLQSQVACPADEPFDPLAVDMVNRANVYLAVKYGPDSSDRNPFWTEDCSYYSRSPSDRPERELITRREIADLGNARSGMVRRLVEYLLHLQNGYDMFARMGLTRRTPSRDDWSNRSADILTRMLRPWSAKQVRTHFDQIRQAKLITAERDPANGPWRYALPEEFSGVHSPFHRLPTVEELAADSVGQPQLAARQSRRG